MRRRLALSVLLCLTAAGPAAADAFAEAEGLWGLSDVPELSCETNPHRVSFSADRRRALFRWEHTMINYEGEPDTEGEYTVLEAGPHRIVLALDGESRRTRDGAPVVWILNLLDGGGRYCWGRTDWTPDECIDRYVRCPAPVPVS